MTGILSVIHCIGKFRNRSRPDENHGHRTCGTSCVSIPRVASALESLEYSTKRSGMSDNHYHLIDNPHYRNWRGISSLDKRLVDA
jgi:hypothetical protein